MAAPADRTPAQQPAAQVIQAYGSGGFTTSGVRHGGAVVVMRTRTLSWSPPADLAALTAEHFAAVTDAAAEVDIVLLGCGARAVMLRPELRAELKATGITVECMDTGAACRTFNLLLVEGRRVAAMLVAVP